MQFRRKSLLTALLLLAQTVPSRAQTEPAPYICNAVFLVQSTEPDTQLTQATLFSLLGRSNRIFFGERFLQILSGRLYHSLRNEPGTGFQPGFEYSSSSPVMVNQDNFLANGQWQPFSKVWEVVGSMRAGRVHYEARMREVAAQVWTEMANEMLTVSPITFFSLYPEIPKERYESVINIMRDLSESHRLSRLAIDTITELLFTMDSWAPQIIGHTPRYYKQYIEGKAVAVVDKFLANQTVIPAPLTSMSAPPSAGSTFLDRAKPDFSATEAVIQRRFSPADAATGEGVFRLEHEIATEFNQLNAHYLSRRELLQRDGEWFNFYRTARFWLKDQAYQIAFLRTFSVMQTRIADYIGALGEQLRVTAAVEAALAHRLEILRAGGGGRSDALAAIGRLEQLSARVKLLRNTLEQWMSQALEARSLLESLFGPLEAGKLDKEAARAAREQLRTLGERLEINAEYLKQIKTGLF